MKILYIKNSSERAKKFQLQTLIYEENGQKFVKKRALTPEAIPHLHAMKSHYAKLTESIIDPRIKLARILSQDERSLTFEFIEGESFQARFDAIANQDDKNITELVETYLRILKNGFRTTRFQSTTMATEAHKELFGDIDYSIFEGEICFEGISNIDLIFSNIIFQGEDIYLIDYEWVFELNLPIVFALFRALAYTSTPNHKEGIPAKLLSSLHSIEDRFIASIETPESFAKYQKSYQKPSIAPSTLKSEFKSQEEAIHYWKEVAQSLRIKNRILRIFGKYRPDTKG